jgi:hypothetical protein
VPDLGYRPSFAFCSHIGIECVFGASFGSSGNYTMLSPAEKVRTNHLVLFARRHDTLSQTLGRANVSLSENDSTGSD